MEKTSLVEKFKKITEIIKGLIEIGQDFKANDLAELKADLKELLADIEGLKD